MGQHNLSRIMKPQQVAVVGASEKSGTIGNALMKIQRLGGYLGSPGSLEIRTVGRVNLRC